MRINKLLSNYGYCSRKEANRWIESGRLSFNGGPCKLGQWVEEGDVVLLDGEPLKAREKIYLLFNKPVGVVCTAESGEKDNLIDYIGYPEYIFPVGRLDKDSQGLMLLTNDGDLANQVLAAENGHEKLYQVWVDKPLTPEFLEGMAKGVLVDGQITRPCVLTPQGQESFHIILSQGLNRQIRKMCRVFGYKVLKLERLGIINLELRDLPLGKYRSVELEELEKLKELIGMSEPNHPFPESK